MEAYKRELIDLMLHSGVLLFGDFTAKSGPETPYFIDAVATAPAALARGGQDRADGWWSRSTV